MDECIFRHVIKRETLSYYETDLQAHFIRDAAQKVSHCGIRIEDDTKNRIIIALADHIVSDLLSDFVRDLQQNFIATPILNMMPRVLIEDRARIQFYLKMAMWYQMAECRCYLQIDWFDIRTLLNQNRRYQMFPPFIADNLDGLFSIIRQTLEGCNETTTAILWLYAPGGDVANVVDLQNNIWLLSDVGQRILWGISILPAQKGFKALLYMMGI